MKNFWLLFAAAHPLLSPVLAISEVLHASPGPKVPREPAPLPQLSGLEEAEGVRHFLYSECHATRGLAGWTLAPTRTTPDTPRQVAELVPYSFIALNAAVLPCPATHRRCMRDGVGKGVW